MSRPVKWRKVCSLPESDLFGPLNASGSDKDTVVMTVEEYETIRLIDLEAMTQEECAERMQVARGTVQSIYKEARQKIAQAIVIGHRLRIEGGTYQLYKGRDPQGQCHRCRRRQGRRFENQIINEGRTKNEDSNTNRL